MLVKNLITKIELWLKQKLLDYKLRKSRFRTWEDYNRWHDPDVNQSAYRVEDFYCGYPYIYCFENRDHYAYESVYDHGPGGCVEGFEEINKWCERHCKDKFRIDFHRVIQETGDTWVVNELGGGDYIFIAFKSERDYLWFLMKWS